MLQCGIAQMDITPALGMEMPGHFHLRRAEGVLENLYAVAAYFENDDGGRVVLVSVDIISISTGDMDRIRAEIADALSLPEACVMVCATHTHTGGPSETWGDFVHTDPVYIDFLSRRIRDTAVLARREKRPVRIGHGRGEEKTLAHYRDFVLADGSYRTNPGPGDKKAFGDIDPEVGVLRIEHPDGSPYGLIANYACHCDCVGGIAQYSSDYPGHMRDTLRRLYGADFKPLFVNGFCGNLNHVDFEHGTSGAPGYYKRMGRVLAAEVYRVCERIPAGDSCALGGAEERFELPTRLPTPELLAWADTIGPDGTVVDRFYAAETKRIAAQGVEQVPIRVQVLRIGELLLFGMPGEIYVEYALTLKKDSPAPYNMTANLANGSVGYVPIPELFQPGIYEARLCVSSNLVENAGNIMTQHLLALAQTV